DRRGFSAIRESWNLAYDHILPTLGIALGLFLVLLLVGVIAALLAYSPQIGPFAASIAEALLAGAATAYATLVIVGEYLVATRPGGVA
ncbi:MAG TPA: hypothetical protein VKG44_05665, partial [Candidatus Baltobacteraceae bacterium]|nr:hypothetical protein [Candidatus Baltobacteraceae bacterium]